MFSTDCYREPDSQGQRGFDPMYEERKAYESQSVHQSKPYSVIELELSQEPLSVSIVKPDFAILKRKDLIKKVPVYITKINTVRTGVFYSLPEALEHFGWGV